VVSMTGLLAELRRVQRYVESESGLKSDANGDRALFRMLKHMCVQIQVRRYPNVLGIGRERRSELGAELWAGAESGVGIDPEAYADSAAKYDPEAGWEARSEAGSGSELRQSDSVRALKSYSVRRNRARYGIAEQCGELG